MNTLNNIYQRFKTKSFLFMRKMIDTDRMKVDPNTAITIAVFVEIISADDV